MKMRVQARMSPKARNSIRITLQKHQKWLFEGICGCSVIQIQRYPQFDHKYLVFDVLVIAFGQMCDETTISHYRTSNPVTLS